VSDVQHGAHSAPRSGHDVAGLGLHLDLPEALVTVQWQLPDCSRPRSVDSDKQTAAGKFVIDVHNFKGVTPYS
jgi:hypothetical protein